MPFSSQHKKQNTYEFKLNYKIMCAIHAHVLERVFLWWCATLLLYRPWTALVLVTTLQTPLAVAVRVRMAALVRHAPLATRVPVHRLILVLHAN